MKQKFFKWLLMVALLPMSAAVYAGWINEGGTFTVNGINYLVTSENNLLAEVTQGNYSGDITIESTVTNIATTYTITGVGDEAFAGNTGLTSVTLPETVQSIGAKAFDGCTGLTEVHIQNPVPGFIAADAIDPSIPIYVPVGTKEAYKAADGWKDLNILEEGESPAVWGDVNRDGKVNSADVQKTYALMAQGATGLTNPEADVNRDGNVNSADIQKIYAIMAGTAK